MLKPLRMRVYNNMHVYITKNVRKYIDQVNGMLGVVESFDAETGGVRVKTRTSYRPVITTYTDIDLGNMNYYPLRPGYASTVMKFQGAELEHVILYADAKSVPGGFYTAASRVRERNHFMVGGNATSQHMTPAL